MCEDSWEMRLWVTSQEMSGDLWGSMASGGCSRRLPLVVWGRGGRAVRTSGRECVAPGRGSGVAGRAVRPGVEHGRPEVRLISGASA